MYPLFLSVFLFYCIWQQLIAIWNTYLMYVRGKYRFSTLDVRTRANWWKQVMPILLHADRFYRT